MINSGLLDILCERMKYNIMDMVAELWKAPDGKSWARLKKALRKSDILYYRVVFADEGRLGRAQDLTKSFAELYDAKERLVARVPVFERRGREIRGATAYLTGLHVLNK